MFRQYLTNRRKQDTKVKAINDASVAKNTLVRFLQFQILQIARSVLTKNQTYYFIFILKNVKYSLNHLVLLVLNVLLLSTVLLLKILQKLLQDRNIQYSRSNTIIFYHQFQLSCYLLSEADYLNFQVMQVLRRMGFRVQK